MLDFITLLVIWRLVGKREKRLIHKNLSLEKVMLNTGLALC